MNASREVVVKEVKNGIGCYAAGRLVVEYRRTGTERCCTLAGKRILCSVLCIYGK